MPEPVEGRVPAPLPSGDSGQAPSRSLFYRLGILACRYRWPVIGVWLALAAVSLLYAPQVASVLQPGGFSNPRTQGSQGVRLLHQEMGLSLSSVTIVFRSASLRADSTEFRAEMERALAPLEAHPRVSRVYTPANTLNPRMVSPDGHTAYAVVGLDAPTPEAQRMMPELKSLLRSTSLQRWVTGGPAAYADIELVSHRDLERAERISLPLALIALLFVFGTAVAAAMPLLVGGVAVLVTLAVVYWLAQAVEMSIFVQNITTMLGLGISIDYALFMVSRFREELGAQPEGSRSTGGEGEAMPAGARGLGRSSSAVEAAVGRTVAAAGRAVFFSGLTVLLGLLGLLAFDYMMLRSMGAGGAMVVGIAMLAALTLLPATLSVAGHRIDALPLPGLGRQPRQGFFWHRVAGAVARRPAAVFLAVLALLVALGLPFLRARMGAPDVTILPGDVESRQGFDVLRSAYGPGEIAPVTVVVEAPGPILQQDHVGALYDYARRIQDVPGVVRVDSIVTLDPGITRGQYQLLYSQPDRITDPAVRRGLEILAGGRVALLSVVTPYNPVADEAKAVVRAIRVIPPGPGLTSYVGGAAAELMDVVSDLYSTFPRALAFIVAATYLALAVQFRSVVLPAKAVVMNTLSILASYGALVLLFQDGHLHELLRFTPEGFVDATVPIVMFCVLFGLSMDYEVFMLSRIREAYDTLGDNRAAVAQGLERTGRIITSAALIIIIVSGSFALADIIVVKALGVGMALAIFLDATIVRALLVPATMYLLGRWNWWAPPGLNAPPGPPGTPPA